MSLFALNVKGPAGPVKILVDDAGMIRLLGTKEKIRNIKTVLRSSTATMHNLDDSKQTTPLRLVRKLFAVFGSGSYQVIAGQSRLTKELEKEQEIFSKGRVI